MPSPDELAIQTATRHQQAGRLSDAAAICRQILATNPRQPQALNLLALVSIQSGDVDMGISLLKRSLELNPRSVANLNNLAITLARAGRFAEAIEYLSAAVQLNPGDANSHYNLGSALSAGGRADEAIAAFNHALQLKPDHYLAQSNLGNLLHQQGRVDEAIAAYRQAVKLHPNQANPLSNLGNSLREAGLFEEASDCLHRALAINPQHAEAHNNYATLLKAQGKFSEAIAGYEQAIRINPGSAHPHLNLAMLLLSQGEYARGWAEYEWRWQSKEFPPKRQIAQPQWTGEPLRGRTILLHYEQGFGDTLQFVRYVPLVAARGGNVILECQPALLRLLKSFPGAGQVIAHGEPLPAFDVHAPLMSLPLLLNTTTLQSIPPMEPFLSAGDELVQKWKSRLTGPQGHLRVGLVWAGSAINKADRQRSFPLSVLAPLANVQRTTFYSLQKGPPAEQAKNPPPGMHLVNLGPDFQDFADTAAAISQLDLVISGDTAVAHLAGAMGRPVWALIPLGAEGRWLRNRDDSPWYPTMGLFRQKIAGDWTEVASRVAGELAAFSSRAR